MYVLRKLQEAEIAEIAGPPIRAEPDVSRPFYLYTYVPVAIAAPISRAFRRRKIRHPTGTGRKTLTGF